MLNAMTEGDVWKLLSRVSALVPLGELGMPAMLLSRGLYRLNHGYYTMTRLRNVRSDRHESGPLLTKLCWAPSDGAARRAVLNEVDADDGAQGKIPPSITAGWVADTYGDLLARGRASASSIVAESAAYAGTPRSRFVHKIVQVDSLEFFFRTMTFDDMERPYAVAWRIP